MEQVKEASTEKFLFFYNGVFSQWHPCHFEAEGTRYNCAEQYMMQQKALLFKDHEAAAMVMATDSPYEQKMIGREVKGFDIPEWNKEAKLIVYRGNLAKFTQNRGLKTLILATKGLTIVEASPTDKIWGIGLAESDARAHDRSKWKGLNWLGDCLNKVRDDIYTLNL